MSRFVVSDPRRANGDPGIWIEINGDVTRFARRPALYLDRDGVINEDSHYPGRPEHIRILESIIVPIRRANAEGWPVIVVTNQSGIARGLFSWADFNDVTAFISAELAVRGARLDLVLACAYHGDGRPPFDVADHPMRKPNPGMFLKAAEIAGCNLERSIVVGDRASDFKAAASAGISLGFAEEIQPISGQLGVCSLVLRPLSELEQHIR